jgi:phage/plasmid-like protein (TIGR03299 family)
MSAETLQHLNTNTLIGFTDKRGHAWHYRAEEQGEESNHYNGAIPLADVERRLFNWKAVAGPVETTILNEYGVQRITDPERQVIVRPDLGTVLGVFKAGYKIHDYNEWLVQHVATILDDDLSIGSAGLLKGGAVAWVSVEVPDTITTPEGVDFRPNLVAVTSLDGSLATTYKRTVTVTVCDNTLALALAEKGQQVKIKHSSKSLGRVTEVREALQIVHTISDDFSAQVKRLCEVTVTDQQWKAFLEAHVPVEQDASKRSVTLADSKRESLTSLWKNDNRVSPWKNTAFGVLQADNTYRHHIQTVRGGERVERNNLQTIDGTVDKQDREVLDTLRKVLVSA